MGEVAYSYGGLLRPGLLGGGAVQVAKRRRGAALFARKTQRSGFRPRHSTWARPEKA